MTSDQPAGNGSQLLASLRSADGRGVVRIEDRFDTDIDDVWSAITDPERLARWLGVVEGDLRVGGEYKARYYASGWEGTGRVDVCEPPHRLRVLDVQGGETAENSTEITLTADGEQTVLVFEQRGMPLELVAAYGAGNQVHIEDLGSHLAGGERCDAEARWAALEPEFARLPVTTE
jgi:uncharacterized protein YndB with AHSA1/START domain